MPNGRINGPAPDPTGQIAPAIAEWLDPARPELLLGILLGDTTILLRRIFDRRVRHLGFTRAQWKIACQLGLMDGLSQTELSDIADIERAPLGKLLDRMEAAGWIERRDDPRDRRIRRVYRTQKLLDFMPQLAKAGEALMMEMLNTLAPDDLAQTLGALQKIKESLMKLDGQSV